VLTVADRMSKWIAGVDGCPGGWIAVIRLLDDPRRARSAFVRTFAELLALDPAPAVISVDMPIGLPERAGIGGRPADIEARSKLGQRQSAIFAVPSRAAVMETEYRRSCEVAFATSEPPRKVSKQCFNLFPKIRELDALMTPGLQSRVYETHPEVAFWALNGEQALSEPKKLKSRPYGPGLELRRGLLAAAGYDRSFLSDASAFRARDVGPDDLLDAAVCSWTAARIARGEGRRFPVNPDVDAKGLRMEIWG
jgi:predicted RNase H-like nuclease